jgi:hypothetical protein
MKLRVSVGVSLAAVCCAVLGAAGPASAALMVSGTGNNGGCSLRATIEDVNNGTAGGCGSLEPGMTTIDVPAGHYLLTSGELVVEEEVAIVGADPANPGATVIDGDEKSRVIEVDTGVSATLDGVEVTGGATLHGVDSSIPEGFGEVGESGGGILNKGSVTLEHVVVTGNRTGRGGNGGNGTVTASFGRNGGQANAGGNGGGIDNEHGASLTVVDSTISNNLTGEGGIGGGGGRGQVPANGTNANGGAGGIGGEGGNGGGIFNEGTLTITGSTISGNATGRGGVGGFGGEGSGPSAEFSGGKGGAGARGGNSSLQFGGGESGVYAEIGGGGGIDNLGTLTMSDSTISGNHTGAGGLGGAAGMGGAKPMGFSGREDAGHAGPGGGAGLGGGLLSNESGTSTLTDVTVTGNFTGDGGNGGNGAQTGSLGSGNGGFGGNGGGIWARGNGAGLTLNFVTIAGNSVGALGEPGSDGEGRIGVRGEPGKGAGIATGTSSGSSGGLTITNSIVAANGNQTFDKDCSEFSAGAIHDGGHDVSYATTFGDTSCPGVNTNPLLGALADNGGPTETMLPGAGSSAIGLVPSGSCSPSLDQRGDSRPGSGKSACDAGAVETGGTGGGPVTTSVTVSSSADPSTVGATVTFTATVSPNPGGGTVEFSDDGTVIGGCAARPVVGGQAICSETFSAAASHSIRAEYSGTAGFRESSSPTLTQTVQEPPASGGGGGGGGGTGGEPGGGTGTGGGGGGEPGGGSTGGSTGGGSPPASGSSTGGGSPTGGSGGGGSTGTTKGTGTTTAGKATVSAVKVSGTSVSVTVKCVGPKTVSCSVKLALAAGGSKGSKATPVGGAEAKIAGGATKTVTVSLDGAGKAELGKAGSLKATLTVDEKGAAKPVSVRTVTFKKG